MLKSIIFFTLFGLSISNSSKEWNQSIDQTKVIFSAKKFQVKVKGAFQDVKVHTNFNSNNLANSYVNVEIRVESISTGKKWRDKKILSKKLFYQERHKFIHLISSKIEKRENGEIYLLGDISIRGITKKVQIPLEVFENKKNITIKSSFKIKRKDFNVGDGSLGMSKSAQIIVAFTGTK
jgi:polyisoprenoid-binding protein YceI